MTHPGEPFSEREFYRREFRARTLAIAADAGAQDRLDRIVPVLEDGDLPRARQMLGEFLERPREHRTGEHWHCGRCGESVDAELDICWNCGSPRG